MTTDALESLLAEFAPDSGCSNHGCYILKPKGMATNGPCSCHRGNKVKINALKAALFDDFLTCVDIMERNISYNYRNGMSECEDALQAVYSFVRKAKRIQGVLK